MVQTVWTILSLDFDFILPSQPKPQILGTAAPAGAIPRSNQSDPNPVAVARAVRRWTDGWLFARLEICKSTIPYKG